MDLDSLFTGRPALKRLALFLYYLALLLTLIHMYGRGDFSTPPFVYQEF
ncbi:MAG: teichoic acid D-Ala incorporation-associated protein DltX [Verrucomicrobia bacterium]|nr:teichoic acid D-Ala incorporation-associated protein DltX [Verrucomicrobiota bacterium]